MPPRLLALATIALFLGLLPAARPERAMACSCGEIDPPAVALEEAAAVFSGKVLQTDGFRPVILTFEVYRVWKGAVTPTFVMMTRSLGAGDCGAPLELGEEYIVYAYETDEHHLLAAWFCTRTYPLKWAEEDLQFLGKGWLPGAPGTGHGIASDEPATGDQGINVTSPLTVVGLMAALAMALAALASASILKRLRQG